MKGKAAEADELKNLLRIERECTSTQNSRIAKHLETIKESNERFAELIERTNVLDKLLQRQQKDKESMRFTLSCSIFCVKSNHSINSSFIHLSFIFYASSISTNHVCICSC